MYQVHVIQEGYSRLNEAGVMTANGTSTLVKGDKYNVLVDTLSPWDSEALVRGLARQGLAPSDITHLVCTHGHPDHVGNNNLFVNAGQHIVGFSVHYKDEYFLHPFECGEDFSIDGDDLVVIPTPGHTNDSVSVKVKTSEGVVVIAGDLFEKEEDLENPDLWKEAGSENEEIQEQNRNKILKMSDFIVPGHGKMFKVKKG